MAYDIFTGLALDVAIQGATWDDGGLTWGTPTYLVGNGADAVKIGSSIGSSTVVLANFLPTAGSPKNAVFFKPGASRAAGSDTITLTMHGNGATASQYGLNGVGARVNMYGYLQCFDLGTGTKKEVAITGGNLADTSEYCVEIEFTGTAYIARLFNASSGVRGTKIGETDPLTLATARANTDRMGQIWRGSSTSAPNLTISRVETVEPATSDTQGPTLSTPTLTATSSTAATGTVATNEAGGVLRSLLTANSTETAATIKASGGSQTVTATGSQTVNFTGQSAGATRYAHYLQTDAAGNDSNVVSSASVTFPAADTQAPVWPDGAAITPGTVTSSSLSGSYPAATDANAVTYQYSTNSGSTWVDNGSGLTFNITGLASGTTYPVWVRAKDPSNNYNTPLQLSMTTGAASGSGATVTSDVVRGYDGLPKANFTIPNVALLKLDRTVALALTNQVTNASGQLVISNAALVAGTDYMLATFSNDGLARGLKKVTAA